MAREQYIVGLDLGTQNIRVVQAVQDEEIIRIVGSSTVPAAGIRKGVITDIDETVSAISAALERVERMTGVPVTDAVISVGGSHLGALQSRGVIAVSRANGEIGESDIQRVVEASQAIAIPPNKEVVALLPKTFILDGQESIKDPTGMTGIRLEVDSTIVYGSSPMLRNVQKAVTQAGVTALDLVAAPLAAAASVLTKRQKELGVAVVTIGAGTTSIAIYEEDSLLYTSVIPLGSMHITNDLAIGLRSSVDTAEKVKILYGQAQATDALKNKEIDLSEIDAEETGTISQNEIAEIINARLTEIFDFITREFQAADRYAKLPAGVVLTGAGALLPGLVEFAKERLKLPVTIQGPHGVDTVIDEAAEPGYATAVGLVLWLLQRSEIVGNNSSSGWSEHENVLKFKKWFKSFLP